MSAHRRDFDESEYKFSLINDNELLEKYNEIWEIVKNRIKKESDSEPLLLHPVGCGSNLPTTHCIQWKISKT